MTRYEIAQAYTQRHMKNTWSEIISCSRCFGFYYYFLFGSYTQGGIIFISFNTTFVALFLPYCFHVFSIIFLLTKGNRMLYLQHFHSANSQWL